MAWATSEDSGQPYRREGCVRWNDSTTSKRGERLTDGVEAWRDGLSSGAQPLLVMGVRTWH